MGAQVASKSKKTRTVKSTNTSKKAKSNNQSNRQTIYQRRFRRHFDELKWLYTELYNNKSMFAELCEMMEQYYRERNDKLKALDRKREKDPNWYKRNDMLGMMLYIDNFGGTIKGVQEKLDYIQRANVNYVHLMPFLDTVDGESDGGYAVKDFRKVRPDLGTMEDLDEFTATCHRKHINVCMDFVMNHTSSQHEWAVKAKQGDGEYMSRYFFYDNPEIPRRFDETVPQVFPTTAPGNFTYLPELNHWVMTSFYPYQWDLNYHNPRVFNEMIYNFLYLVNQGIDVMRLDAVPYIWKEIGTDCRNLQQVHTLVRMMRIISEIVCPGVLLLGEVVMEPVKVAPYFGTTEKPECHMLYNVTTMATTWNSVATRDVRLLKQQLDTVNSLPKDYVFLNYLRCHDDLGWGLDYWTLSNWGMTEFSHKHYLNDYFQGKTARSNSRGELYNDDETTGDARFCGTTASMCGVERAGFEHNGKMMDEAIQQDLMLHAYMFMQSGIPVIYSGDEVGQVNDYTYKQDPRKCDDSRYLHRGHFRWDLAEKIDEAGTVENRLFEGLNQLETLRKREKAFVSTADTWTVETYDASVLCIGRYYDNDKIFGIFNFSEQPKTAWIHEDDGDYRDLLTGQVTSAEAVKLEPYGFKLMKWIR